MARPSRPVNAHRFRPASLVLAALLALGGCTVFDSPVVQRGNRVTEDQIREINVGVQTRNDVQTLLGSPSARSTFDESSWYYISSITRQRPGRALSVRDQRVVAIDFDNRGVVSAVRELGENDGQNVSFVERETPVPGNEQTIMQALFGNVGRFTPGGMGAAAQGSGATSAGSVAR